jgi:Protein of unknown function (DUF2958)
LFPNRFAPRSSPMAQRAAIMRRSSNCSTRWVLRHGCSASWTQTAISCSGCATLGSGAPELGSASLSEIVAVDLPLGLKIERDLYFTGEFPLTVYAEAARALGRITEDSARLQAAAASLAADRLAEHSNRIPPRVPSGSDG